jgi:hypothetical protein
MAHAAMNIIVGASTMGRGAVVAGRSNYLSRRRLPWVDLLHRVFAQDVLACPCGGRRAVTASVVDTQLARSVLTALGPPSPPPSHRHVTSSQVKFA